MKFEATLMKTDIPDSYGRIYSKEALEKTVEEFKNTIPNKDCQLNMVIFKDEENHEKGFLVLCDDKAKNEFNHDIHKRLLNRIQKDLEQELNDYLKKNNNKK